jgi:A/G-specific adenine glycosylase
MQKELLDWFDRNKRFLPWRENRSPYSVWISEIMLQQTRVESVIPYFLRWMDRFPNICVLADSEEQTVLRLWEGLGYYSRARSLHRTANIICRKMDGIFPSEPKEIEKLPGIGKYTAGAIASIAFGKAVPAIDGNIRRIYSRIRDINLPARSTESEKTLWQLAADILDHDRPGDYNEALMDLGTAICTPTNPLCEVCPIISDCQAFRNQTVAERPVVIAAKPIPHYMVTAAVILKREKNRPDRYLLAQRPAKGLLGNLWEFPGGKIEGDETPEECIQREIREELAVQVIIKTPFGKYKHAYTHFRVTLNAFLCEIEKQIPQPVEAQAIEWVSADCLDDYPMGKIDRQISLRIRNFEKGESELKV